MARATAALWHEYWAPVRAACYAGLMFRWRDALSGLASFAVLFGLVSGAGCGTDAKAVDECRDIEQARCEAGKACGLVEDVEACKRFYRDHCLHGMIVESPGQSQVDRCVETIEKAGTCAQSLGADATLEQCPEVTTGASATLACDVVLYPENTLECDFLTPDPVATGSGGTGGGANPDGGDSYAALDGGSDAGAGGVGGAPSAGGSPN